MDAATTAAKRAEHREIKERALAITDKAIAEDRQLTEAEAKQLADHVEQAKTLQHELQGQRIGASPELLKQLEELGRRPESWPNANDPYSGMKVGYGDTLARKDADTPHPWTLAIDQHSRAQGTKAFAAPSSGSIPLPAVSTVPVSMGQLGAPLVGAIGLRPWPGRRRPRRDLPQADGEDEPGCPVALRRCRRWVGHPKQTCVRFDNGRGGGRRRDDCASGQPGEAAGSGRLRRTRPVVASKLGYGISQSLEAALINQTGTEPQLVGLLHLPGTTPVAAATDIPTTLMNASVALGTSAMAGGCRLCSRRVTGRPRPR